MSKSFKFDPNSPIASYFLRLFFRYLTHLFEWFNVEKDGISVVYKLTWCISPSIH